MTSQTLTTKLPLFLSSCLLFLNKHRTQYDATSIIAHYPHKKCSGSRMENGTSTLPNGDTEHLPSAPSTLNTHGLLSRLSFLRSPTEEKAPQLPLPDDAHSPHEQPLHHLQHSESAMSSAVRQHNNKTRKRKGSLRKTALLGPGRTKFERHSPAQEAHALLLEADIDLEKITPSRWALPPPNHPLQLDTATSEPRKLDPVTSPTGPYASTTDDDADSGIHLPLTDLARRRSVLRPAPIIPVPQAAHSYSETEWWGWIILFTTWLVFVVGMGSCLGVWSWAWDVGETPYAPPELEDDPTLPIVGYYPALIVCTGVMAWVWVVVAWLGMKYFRHARFEIADGEEYI